MPTNDKKFWFRAKRYGWGWGLPCAWQGWVVMAGYIVLVGVGMFLIPFDNPGLLIGYFLGLLAVLITICAVKGEKPRWRWGGE